MRHGFWEPIAAVTGVLVLGGVGVWWWLTVLEPPRAPVPGHRGAPFEPISAAMPQIRDFKDFNINNDNPFVSWRERLAEKERIEQPTKVAVKPVRPPPIIKVTQPPILNLPKIQQGGGDAPKVGGFSRKSDGVIAVLVSLPGEARSRLMNPGEQAGRWTFITVEDGNVALFKDETGREYRLVIGGAR